MRSLFKKVGLLLVFSGGVLVLVFADDAKPARFSHEKHVVSLRLGCEQCHSLTESGATVSMPEHDSCSFCHSIESPDDCGFCHASKENFALFSHEKRYPGTRFSHRVHIEKKLACKSCHPMNEASRERLMPVMKNCLQCHGDQDLKTWESCHFCHLPEFLKTKPASHTFNWALLHSRKTRPLEERQKCNRCHESGIVGKCRDCHKGN